MIARQYDVYDAGDFDEIDGPNGLCDLCNEPVYAGDGHVNTHGWSMSLGTTVDVTYCKRCLEGDGE